MTYGHFFGICADPVGDQGVPATGYGATRNGIVVAVGSDV